MLLSSIIDADVHPQPEKSGGEESGELRGQPGRRRSKKKPMSGPAEEARKRRLSDAQVQFLEVNFVEERKLESGRKAHLAAEIGLDPKQVAVWFQNRRARWKAKRMEDEFSKLKAAHNAAVLHNGRLESEVLRLKEKIFEAEAEIMKLSERGRGDSVLESSNGGSPCSSSLETDQNILHDRTNIEGEGGGLLKCIPDDYYYNDYVYMMDWTNLYHDL